MSEPVFIDWNNVKRLIEIVEEPGSTGIELNGLEMSVSFRELAALFALHGWQLAGVSSDDNVPNGLEIALQAKKLIDRVADGHAEWSYAGRLMALQDTDLPDTVELYLHVGNYAADGSNVPESRWTADE